MWVARFKLSHDKDIFTDRTKKYGVKFLAYPLTHYSKDNKIYFVVNGFLEGENAPKKGFLKSLSKDPRIVRLEHKNDYINVLIHYPDTEIVRADMQTFYDPAVIHVEPILNSVDGFEYWTVASFEKENLQKLIASAQKLHKGKLLMMVQKKFDDFSIMNIRPKISSMQRVAIVKAFEEGYYSYPRKIEIKKLAKILGISYSTCQEHLRKAEMALLPELIKKL